MTTREQIYEAAVADMITATKQYRKGIYDGPEYDAMNVTTGRAIKAGYTPAEIEAEADRRIDNGLA